MSEKRGHEDMDHDNGGHDDKRPRTMSKAGASGKSSGTGTGVSGTPTPMTFPQGQRKIDSHTVTCGGTIFIDDAYGISGTDPFEANHWVKFPWEYWRLFMNEQQIMEIMNTWLYWKCSQVECRLKILYVFKNIIKILKLLVIMYKLNYLLIPMNVI